MTSKGTQDSSESYSQMSTNETPDMGGKCNHLNNLEHIAFDESQGCSILFCHNCERVVDTTDLIQLATSEQHINYKLDKIISLLEGNKK